MTDMKLAERVLAFLLRNPDEALSTKDIGLKFDVKPHLVDARLHNYVQSRMLKRDKRHLKDPEYTLGPKASAMTPAAKASLATAPAPELQYVGRDAAPAAAPIPAPKVTLKPERASKAKASDMRLDQLPIVKGVPARKMGNAGSVYRQLLDRLLPDSHVAIPPGREHWARSAASYGNGLKDGRRFGVRKLPSGGHALCRFPNVTTEETQ